MSVIFANVVEEVKQLSQEEKNDLKNLIEHLLIEERRAEFARDHKDSEQEYKAGKLKFSDNISELKNMMDND